MTHGHTAAVDDPGGPPHVHHMDPPTAYSAAKLGMWLFLATEILLFAVLFTAFAIYRWRYLGQFHLGSAELDWRLGAFNTVVLLISSFTAALAVDAAQRNRNDHVVMHCGITIGCAFIFLVVKFFEYKAKFEHHLYPSPDGQEALYDKYKSFFGLYFTMTGLHGLHVIIGMGVLGWVLMKARQNRFSSRYYTPVEMGALYWHLVDVIWIFLFPLLYLVG
jgi:cytochrome c oxidase subunit III